MATNYSGRVDATSAAMVNRPFLSGRSPGVDELATWTKFFGPPPVKQQNFGEDIVETHHDLYKVYEGQNLYLADTITGFILSDVSWETSVLPWLETDQMHITFNRFEFKNTLATPVPYEGIPRLVVSSGSTFSDSVHRLGIGFIMEADMLSTPEGVNQYNMNLAQMSQASMEAVKYATIVKILICKDYEKERQDVHRPNDRKVTAIIEEKEVEFFGIMSVNREGFARMIEDARATMELQKSDPDTLILPPRSMMFEGLIAQGTYTEYWQTGPDGAAFLRAGPPANGRYRNLAVYETREFDVYTNGLRFNPLVRRVTIGEHYFSVFGPWRSARLPANFQNDWRSLYIYDIDSNDWEKVDFITMFKHANLFGNSQTNPNDLHPMVEKLAKYHNEIFINDSASEAERYRPENLQRLDNMDGNSTNGRRIFFMLAHNFSGENRRVDPVTSFQMMDIDVMNTRDVEQSAQSIVNKSFPDEEARKNATASANELGLLITDLESQPYNETYAQALASENAASSVDQAGVFRGARANSSDPVGWVGNEYGGLDLPQSDVAGGVTIPIGAADYGNIATLAAQGEARGYDRGYVARAKRGVEFIRSLTRSMNENAQNTKALGEDNVPDWYNPKLPEQAVFNHMYVTRPPVWLGIASDEKERGVPASSFKPVPTLQEQRRQQQQQQQQRQQNIQNFEAGPESMTGEKVKIVWNPLNEKQLSANVFPDLFPRVRYIDALYNSDANSTLESLSESLSGVAPQGGRVATPLDTYLFNLLENGATAGNDPKLANNQKAIDEANKQGPQKAEEARQALVSELVRFINTATKPEYAPNIVKQLQDWIAKLPADKAAATPEATNAFVTQISNAAKESAKKARSDYSNLTKADQEKQAQLGEILMSFKQGTGIPVKVSGETGGGKARGTVFPFLSEALPTINSELLTPISRKAGSNNLLQALAKVGETLEAVGRSLYPITKMQLSADNYKSWVDHAIKQDKLDKKQMDQASEAYSEYVTIAEEVEKRANAAYQRYVEKNQLDSMDEEFDQEESSFESAGRKAPIGGSTKDDQGKEIKNPGVIASGKPKVWFRAPLVNSPALMRSLANQSSMPLFLPADPRSNYRTVYAPWAKDPANQGVELSLDDFAFVTADATMQETTSTSLRSVSKPLLKEARIQALLKRSPVDKFFTMEPDAFQYSQAGLPKVRTTGGFAEEQFNVNAIREDVRKKNVHFGAYDQEEALRVAESMKEINRKRMLQGQPARNFDRDFTVAQMSADKQSRARAQAEDAMFAANEISQNTVQAGLGNRFAGFDAAGANGNAGSGNLAFDPVARAQMFSTSATSAGKKYTFPMTEPRTGIWRGDVDNRSVQYDINRLERESTLEDAQDDYLEGPFDYMAADPRFYGDRRWATTRGRGYVNSGYYSGERGIDPNNPTYGLHGVYARDQRFYNRSGIGQGGSRPDRTWPGQVPPAEVQATEEFNEATHPNVKYRHERAHRSTDPLIRLASVIILQTPNNYLAWINLIKNDIHVPINLILWRLNIELEMNSAILMESGIQTGANVVGKAGAAISGSVADRMVYGSYVFHHATMIFNEKNIFILLNTQFSGYIAGLDTTFVMTRKELKQDERGSLIVTAIPITENKFKSRLNFVDTTTARLLPSQTNRTKDVDPISSTSSNRYYQEIWGYNEQYINHTRATNRYHTQSLRVNVRSSEGKYYSHAGTQDNLWKLHKGQGHLAGKKTGPGVRKVLVGTNATMLDDDTDPAMRQF